jgi:hypothetical protein
MELWITSIHVMPVKTGIQYVTENLDSGFRRNDDFVLVQGFLYGVCSVSPVFALLHTPLKHRDGMLQQ